MVERGELTVLNARDVTDHNDFGAPNTVVPTDQPVKMKGKRLNYVAPKHSINTFVFTLN